MIEPNRHSRLRVIDQRNRRTKLAVSRRLPTKQSCVGAGHVGCGTLPCFDHRGLPRRTARNIPSNPSVLRSEHRLQWRIGEQARAADPVAANANARRAHPSQAGHRQSPIRRRLDIAPSGDGLRRSDGSRRARLRSNPGRRHSNVENDRPDACAQSSQRKRPARRIWS